MWDKSHSTFGNRNRRRDFVLKKKNGSCIKCWSIEGFTIEAPLPGSAADLTPAQILTGHCKLCVKSRMPHYNAIFQKEPPNFSRCRSRSNISVVLYFALERANYE